jgi:hypothetical protein
MLKDLGLDPCWDKHGFADQEGAATTVRAVEQMA